MGASLPKPVTDKVSESGEFMVGSRKVLFGATAMQGWRISMEDAHCIDSKFDDNSALLAVYDGHGGREVAVYCATHLGEMIKSCKAYSEGDTSQALRDAFMKCDDLIIKEDAVKEMKKIVEEDISKLHSYETEDLDTLLEEANMPLNALLARYKEGTSPSNDEESPGSSSVGNTKENSIRNILQLVGSQTGLLEIEFDNSDSDSDSQEENSDIDTQMEDPYEQEESSKESKNCVGHRLSKTSLESLLSSKPQETKHSNGAPVINANKPTDRQEGQMVDTHHNDAKSCGDIQSEAQATLSDGSVAIEESRSQLTVTSKPNHSVHDKKHTKSCLLNNDTYSDYDSNSSSIHDCHKESQAKSSEDPLQQPKVTSVQSKESVKQQGETKSLDTSATSVPPLSDEEYTSNALPLGDSKQSSNRVSPSESEQPSEAKISREHGLVHLLTSRSNPLQYQSEDPRCWSMDSGLHLPRKRPHPNDDVDENDEESNFVPKRRAVMDDEGYHSGTTAVVTVLTEDQIIVANAGDSRCVVSSNGVAMDLSFDHKPTDLPELQRIERAGGIVGNDGRVNGGLNLSRAIGDHFYKENTSLPLEEQMITAMPDIQTLTVTEDIEFIVLACDGIWNSKSSQEVVDFVRCRITERTRNRTPAAEDLVKICESLCDACLAPDTNNDGTGCDNMTCIIALLQ